MRRSLEKQLLYLLERLSNSTGRSIDIAYASLIHRLGLSPPFFKHGWGDLNIISFQEDAALLSSWPPAHFDVRVSLLILYCLSMLT